MASSGIPTAGAVAVGGSAGPTRSINVLMTLAGNTPNSSLDAREKNYMDDILTYGVCMPYQVQTVASLGSTGTTGANTNWTKNSLDGTWHYTAMSEFKGSYRWAQIVTGNTIIATNDGNSPYVPGNNGRCSCTGNGSPAYINSGTPYFFYIINTSGSPRYPASGWTQATLNSGQTAQFTSMQNGNYNCFVKDWEGCGSTENLKILNVSIAYP